MEEIPMRTWTTGAVGSRRTVAAVAALVALVAGAVAAGTVRPAAAASTKVLHYGVPSGNLSGGVTNAAAIQSTDGPILSIAYAPLIHNKPDGSFGPGLAVKWRYLGTSHKVFELTLRHNARFSDGEPVDAAAVVTWLRFYHTSKNTYSELLGSNPQFKAIGKWTVRITMKAPNPTLPLLFSEENVNWGFVASPKAVANPKLFTKGSYGAGPYMLDYDQSVPGDHYVFVPNPYFYDQSAIRFAQVYVKGFADASSALQAQEAGQIDVAWNPDSSVAPAAAKAGIKVVAAPFAVSYVQLNPKASKPLADVRVRRAMNYAIDSDAIAKALSGKYASGTSEFSITPDADPGLQHYYTYNPAKARKLLAAAGYPDGFEFTIDTRANPPRGEQLIAHYLDAVGIKTKVVSFPSSAAFFNQILKFKDDGWVLGGDVGVPTTIEYGGYLAKGSSFRPGEPVDPKIDRLYAKGLHSSNPTRYWKQMWALVVTDAYFLPFTTASDLFFVSKSVGGVKMSTHRPYAYPSEWYFK
jgi:peptide/nickel transport system substrate-binding protein